MPKLVQTQLLEDEYNLLQSFKQEMDLKTDYQALKELVKSLDIPDFEAKRGRKSRFERAMRSDRDMSWWITQYFGTSDSDPSYRDRKKMLKRVQDKSKQEGMKITVTDFDKWWYDPISPTPKGRQIYGQEVKEDNIDRSNLENWVRDLENGKV